MHQDEFLILESVEEPSKFWSDQHDPFACLGFPVLVPLWAPFNDDFLDGAAPIANPNRIAKLYWFTAEICRFPFHRVCQQVI